MGEARRQLPPYLYLPCRLREGATTFDPVLRDVEAGAGLPAYTALDRLQRVWGHDHGWVVIPLELLTDLRTEVAFDRLLVDDGLDEEHRARV